MAFPASEPLLTAAEAKIGRSLPAPLRTRLIADNGGTVRDHLGQEWSLHPVLDTSDRKRLGRTAYDIARETAGAKDQHGFPLEAIAIAADDYGNRLVLLPESEDIYAWDHETGAMDVVVIDWTITT